MPRVWTAAVTGRLGRTCLLALVCAVAAAWPLQAGAQTVPQAANLVLYGANIYAGGTRVTAGTFVVGNNEALDSGSLTMSAGTTLAFTTGGFSVGNAIALSGDPTIDTSSGNETLGGVISGTGATLNKTGANTLTLTNTETYTGPTAVNGGTLALGAGGSIAASSGVGLLASGTGFDISGAGNQTIGDLTGVVGSTVSLGSNVLTIIAANTDTFNGVIQDGGIAGGVGGAISKSGLGILLFTQPNTYTGASTISSGTLALTGTGSIATSSGVILSASGANFDISDTFTGATLQGLTGVVGTTVSLGSQTLTVNLASGANTFNGVLQDGGIGGGAGGSLALTGAGTLLLTQVNTYTGPTTVSGGTLAVTGTGSVAASSGVALTASGANFDISDTGSGATVRSLSGVAGSTVSLGNRTLTVNVPVGGSATFAGVLMDGGLSGLSGGSLAIAGPGTEILTGTNTYTGTTSISAGTLQIGNGGTSGSIAGNVVDNAALAFDRSDSPIFAGVISGTGTVTQAGSGTLVLTGTNTYGGGTTISAGTLQIGNGGTSGSVAGNITDNSALVFDRSDTVTFIGGIAGASSATLSQRGTGSLILDANNSGFAGTTTVAAGTLEVGDASHTSATLGGNVLVSGAGTLLGHGTIGGSVANTGNVQPGGTIGVLSVTGNYTQSSAGMLTIEITPAAAAGAGAGYSQLSVGGTASLAGTLGVIADTGNYTVGSRYTVLTAAGGRSGTFATVANNPLSFGYITPAVSYDPTDVYVTLAPTPSTNPSAPAPIFNGGQQVPDALTAMASAAEGIGDTVLADVCGPQAQRLVAPGQGCVVRPLAGGYQSELWMRGLGGVGGLTGSGSRLTFNDDYAGMLIGAGVSRGGFTVGAGGGFMATGLNFSDGSTASQNAGVAFVYGRYAQGPWWLGAMGAYGGGGIDGYRALPGTGLTASGDRSGDFAVVQGRAAYDLALGPVTIEPRGDIAYIHAGQSGFAESGASLLDLTYPTTHADMTDGRLTVRAMRQFTAGSWQLVPWAEAGMQQTFSGLSRDVLVTDGPFSADVAGVSPAPTAGVVGVGMDAAATSAMDLFFRYQGQFSANQTGTAFSAGMAWHF